jgi:hypothetical protein
MIEERWIMALSISRPIVTGRSRPPYKDFAIEISYVVNDVVMDVNSEVRDAGGGAEWK